MDPSIFGFTQIRMLLLHPSTLSAQLLFLFASARPSPTMQRLTGDMDMVYLIMQKTITRHFLLPGVIKHHNEL